MNEQNPIQSLITQKRAFNQLAVAQMPSAAVYDQARAWYFEAMERGVIALLFRLVRLVPSESYQGQYKGRPLSIKLLGSNIEAKWGDAVLLTNERPGEEALLPGEWLAFCASEISRIEAELAAKKEADQKRIEAAKSQKKIAQDDQAQEWFSVDV